MDANSTTHKVDFTITEHTDGLLAKRFGNGWYYAFDGIDISTGPFPTRDAAHAAAIELVEQSVAAALVSALFGEAA
ncbi:hypothetical protein HJB53_30010 [Rhizobium lentis]|uniref:hypothetical protein n=1 Tax=Rhizobium lentis TaxID=1138194 RepID=UPI001C83A8E3|nr:hypothetical protein [Rhizobium lentis]MBX5130726.1 hypothetical protein [Rhizobium lentis]